MDYTPKKYHKPTKEKLIEYSENYITNSIIAKEFGVHEKTVEKWYQGYGIKKKRLSKAKPLPYIDMFLSGLTIVEIANECGRDPTSVRDYLTKWMPKEEYELQMSKNYSKYINGCRNIANERRIRKINDICKKDIISNRDLPYVNMIGKTRCIFCKCLIDKGRRGCSSCIDLHKNEFNDKMMKLSKEEKREKMKTGWAKLLGKDATEKEKFIFYKYKSKARLGKYKCNLSYNDVEKIIGDGICQVTGDQLELSIGSEYNKTISIDRIDNDKMYTLSNCWCISHRINSIKGNMNRKQIEYIFPKFFQLKDTGVKPSDEGFEEKEPMGKLEYVAKFGLKCIFTGKEDVAFCSNIGAMVYKNYKVCLGNITPRILYMLNREKYNVLFA